MLKLIYGFNVDLTHKTKTLFTILLACLPILNVYAFVFIQGLSLGMMIATIFFGIGFFVLIYKRKINKKSFPLILLLSLWLILGSLGFFLDGWVKIELSSYAYNLTKILVWGFIIALVSANFFYGKIFVNTVYTIAIVATIYLILQVLLVFLFGLNVSNGLNLGIISANYSDYIFDQDLDSGQVRLSSIWFEPNQYANYILLAMICLLFGEHNYPNKKIIFLLFFLGLVLSTSTTAIMWLLILFLLMAIFHKRTRLLMIIFFVCFSFLLFLNLDNILNILKNYGVLGNSLYMSVTKLEGWKTSARLGASYNAAFSILNYDIYKWVGTGFGSEDHIMKSLNMELLYLNSFSRVFITTGIIGVLAYILFYLFLLFKFRRNRLSFVLVTYCFVGGFYSTMWTSPDSILYFSLAFFGSENST